MASHFFIIPDIPKIDGIDSGFHEKIRRKSRLLSELI